MAESVIKIAADFSAFVANAKKAEKSIQDIDSELKALGLTYEKLERNASRTTNDSVRANARNMLNRFEGTLSQRAAAMTPGFDLDMMRGKPAALAFTMPGYQQYKQNLDLLKDHLRKLGTEANNTKKSVFGLGKSWSGLGTAQSSLSRITGGFAELSRTLLRNITGSRAFASVLMGLTAPLALTVGALAILGQQFAKTEQQMAQMSAGMGGAWGRSMGMEEAQAQVQALAQEYGVTERAAREAFTSIASNARLPEKMIDPMIKKLGDMQAWLGKGFNFDGAKQTLQELSQAFTIGTSGDGLDNLRSWINNLGGLDEETQKQIKSLHDLASATDDYGKKGEYMAQIFDLIAGQAEGARDKGLIPFNTAIDDAKRALFGLWNDLSNSSAWETFFSLVGKAITLVSGFARVISVVTETAVTSLANWAGEKISAVGGWIKDNMPGGGFLADFAENLDSNPTLELARRGFQMMMDFGSGAKNAKEELGGLTFQTKALNAELGKTEQKANKAMAPMTLKAPKTSRKGGGGRSRVDQDAKAAERYLQQLQEEVDQVNKMNKLQRLEYDVSHNKIKLNDKQLAQARELASIIVERTRLEKEAQRAEELRVMQEEKILALKVRQAEFDSKIANYFRSDYASEYSDQMLQYAQELERTLSKLNQSEAKELRQAERDKATPEQLEDIRRYYANRRQIEEQYIRDSVAAFEKFWVENERLSANWKTGFDKAVKNIADQYKDMASDMQKATENWASSMADALAEFVRTGKLDFKSLADSIINDISRIAAKQFISALFGGINSGWTVIGSNAGTPHPSGGGSSGGGFWSGLFGAIRSIFSFFSEGGYTGPGGKYQPAGIVHAGEFVINAASTKKLGLDFLNKLNGYADGGYVSPLPPIVRAGGIGERVADIEVNIYNQTDSQVTQRRNPDTGALDIFIRHAVSAVAADIGNGGAVAGAIQNVYALNRGAGVMRGGY